MSTKPFEIRNPAGEVVGTEASAYEAQLEAEGIATKHGKPMEVYFQGKRVAVCSPNAGPDERVLQIDLRFRSLDWLKGIYRRLLLKSESFGTKKAPGARQQVIESSMRLVKNELSRREKPQ